MTQELIQSLQNKALYALPITQFKVIETHISWVILTGEYAYKIKKPVNFGFLDFTSLEKRQYFCNEELRLNQRLAPEIYLNVIPIYGNQQQPTFQPNGEIIEYAIKMREFSQKDLFDQLQSEHQLTSEHIIDLAQQLAQFHKNIPSTPKDNSHGNVDMVIEPIKQNFEQIKPLLKNKNDINQLEQLESWALDTYDRLKEQFTLRKNNGKIRECHGDVHLKNITLFNNKVTVFDCIEFNDAFRWIDIISEVAFLVMDLEDRKLNQFAWLFLNTYCENTGDYEALPLLNFYKSYRAMVRAKVNLLRLTQENISDEENTHIWKNYYNYINLAETYMNTAQPCLIITHGVSGTGKSTFTSQLIEKLPGVRLRSDVERKRLAGLSAISDSNSTLNQGLYTTKMTNETYHHLAALTNVLLNSGFTVIIDATFLKLEHRRQFQDLAETQGVLFLILNFSADDRYLKQRIISRRDSNTPDASEATIEVLEQQLKHRDPLNHDEISHAITININDDNESKKLILAIKNKLNMD